MLRLNKLIKFTIILTGIFILSSNSAIANKTPQHNMKLNTTEITQNLQSLPDWKLENQSITRTFRFTNFLEAMDFVNRLVEPSETAGHHPDIAISYNKVTISLTTHDAGGLTQKDFDLAKTISNIFSQL